MSMQSTVQETSDTYKAFIADLHIPGCITQAGELQSVEVMLDPDNFQSFLASRESQDLYFLAGVQPERKMERARDDNVIRKAHFFIDCDLRANNFAKTDEEIKDLAETFAGSLDEHPYLNTWRYIVFSGNGLHIHYFGLPVTLRSAESWREGMKSIVSEFEKHTKMEADKACVNAARLCRIPGSYNNKNGRHVMTEILLSRPNVAFDMSLVERLGREGAQHGGLDGLMAKKVADITKVPEGSRNNTLASLAGSLHHRGLDESTISDALQVVNQRKCIPPLPTNEVSQIAKSIGKYPIFQKGSIDSTCTAVTICMADVMSEKVSWLWDKRIPRGKITLIEGDPGLGKSWCSLAIASAVTTGTLLPDEKEHRDPANVLLLTAEDGLGDTIRPRLEIMGADLSRATALKAVTDQDGKERHFSLDEDLAAVEKVLAVGGYALVVIDPLNAYLGAKIDTHKDAALRSVLTPLAQMAERHDVAIVCIRHLTKSSKDRAIYRGQGSIAYTAASRVVHLVGQDPNDKDQRVMACIKNNLASFPMSLAFEIRDDCFRWKGTVDISGDSLLGSFANETEQTARSEASQFLLDVLFDEPQPATEIERQGKEVGISPRTLKRAKADLGVIAKKTGFGKNGTWTWELPKDANLPTEKTLAPLVNHGINQALLSPLPF